MPTRKGKRNLENGLEQAAQLITPGMGDRPNVPNVCLILTSATASDLAAANQSGFLGEVCDYLILLRQGSNKELQKISATICPNGELYFLFDQFIYSRFWRSENNSH